MMRYLSLLIIFTLLSSCGRYFMPDKNLQRHVQKSEVIGTWIMTPESIKLMVRDGYVVDPTLKYQMIIRLDGTMSFDSVGTAYDNYPTIRAEGSYFIAHHEDGTTTLGTNLWYNNIENNYHYSFAEEDGVLTLWEYHGDPDSWEFIEYTKK